MRHIGTLAKRLIKQLVRNKRFLMLSIVPPFIIIYFLKLFMDTMAPGFPSARYILPISAFLIHFLTLLGCSLVLVEERANQTLERIFINGVKRVEIISGFILGYFGIATFQASVVLIEAIWLFKLDYSLGTFLALFGVMWLLAIVSVMIGIFISTFARNGSEVIPFFPLLIVPSVFLSGLLVKTDLLPTWAQIFGKFFPMYYANNIVQELIAKNPANDTIWQNVGFLILYAIGLLIIASNTLKEVE
jgi:ABC-2 type transport system permease protein